MKLNRLERILFTILPQALLRKILPRFNKYKFFLETQSTQTPISFDVWYSQKVRGHCSEAYWPVHSTSKVVGAQNIYCGIETSPGLSNGCYIQGIGKIFIGDYTQIAPNVGIISANHELEDNRQHVIKDVYIDKYCWIGFGAVILPGVRLGEYTIVAAGSVVTKSFEDGFCVIGGSPAKLIKRLDRRKCVFHKSENEYNGYIPSTKFEDYRQKHLKI